MLLLQGAFVLDTLLNFDPSPGSQVIPDNWEDILPEVTSKVRSREERGDFISVVSRLSNLDEQKFSKTFAKYYTRLNGHSDR